MKTLVLQVDLQCEDLNDERNSVIIAGLQKWIEKAIDPQSGEEWATGISATEVNLLFLEEPIEEAK